MQRYRIVTGWYPSLKSAEKVFDHVRGKVNHVHIQRENKGFYTNVLEYVIDVDEAVRHRDAYIDKGVYCGIELSL